MKRLAEEIWKESQKLILRHERYAKDLHDEIRRRMRRSNKILQKTVFRPASWSLAPGFNPYIVRSRSDSIAHSIRLKLRRRTYEPRCAVSYSVPKEDGSERKVSVFQVPDACISRLVFKSLLQKNRPRLSAYSFAYRADLTVHDAIQHIAGDIRGKDRVFVAEYDFSKYFDSIYHDHIWRILNDQRFLFTEVERLVMEAFLTIPMLEASVYTECADQKRHRGVPQGTSISLF